MEFGDGITVIGEWRPAGEDIELRAPAYRPAKGKEVASRNWILTRRKDGGWRSELPDETMIGSVQRSGVEPRATGSRTPRLVGEQLVERLRYAGMIVRLCEKHATVRQVGNVDKPMT